MLADFELATFVFGFTLGCSVFCGSKAIKQTYLCWRRSGKINAYIAMVWLEWATSLVVAIVIWIFIQELIYPR